MENTNSILTRRSQEKELIDLGPDYYTQQEYEDCLEKLFRVNRFFGFFYSTRKWLAQFPKESTLLDIGCGGGLFLLHLSRCFPQMRMLGTDISSDAIDEAQLRRIAWQKKHLAPHVSFQVQSQPDIASINKRFDILLATLIFHHLPDDELPVFLKETYRNAKIAVIINDLHRHPIAHWCYARLAPLLFRNRLITHDGLISIRRGFTRNEIKRLLHLAGIEKYSISWRFPFRWQIVLWKTNWHRSV